jgi:hypothetical protein
MIVKLGQNPGFKRYVSKNKRVKAVKMRGDFLVETSIGFMKGKRGEYLVESAPRVRFTCAEKEFLAAYSPEKNDAEG